MTGKRGLYRAESDASAPRDCPHLARVRDLGTHPGRGERNGDCPRLRAATEDSPKLLRKQFAEQPRT